MLPYIRKKLLGKIHADSFKPKGLICIKTNRMIKNINMYILLLVANVSGKLLDIIEMPSESV